MMRVSVRPPCHDSAGPVRSSLQAAGSMAGHVPERRPGPPLAHACAATRLELVVGEAWTAEVKQKGEHRAAPGGTHWPLAPAPWHSRRGAACRTSTMCVRARGHGAHELADRARVASACAGMPLRSGAPLQYWVAHASTFSGEAQHSVWLAACFPHASEPWIQLRKQAKADVLKQLAV
jgi:hypothetical protein